MKFFGKYRAIVTDVKDPENKGRIKVKCPKVLGEYSSHWCMPCVPYAVDNGGIFFLPELQEVVWIEFEEGDPDKPIWVGGWWAKNLSPILDADYNLKAGKRKMIKTTKHTITIDDNAGAENITIEDYSGNKIVMDKDGIIITSCKDITFISDKVYFNDIP